MLCLHRGESVPAKLQDNQNWTLMFLIWRCHRKKHKILLLLVETAEAESNHFFRPWSSLQQHIVCEINFRSTT